MFRAILAKIPALAPLVTLTLAAILLTLAAPAYADGHYDEEGPFWVDIFGLETRLHKLAYLFPDDDPVADLAHAKDLLNRGANPNVIAGDAATPLNYAVSSNFFEMASLLIANRAVVNAIDIHGWTAMDWAIHGENTKMQALLREHGGKCFEKC